MIESPNDAKDSHAPFRCDVTYVEDRAVVMARGEIDLVTAPVVLREALGTLALPVRGIVIDLRHVPFMDSSGIQALNDARRQALERGIEFTLASVPPQPRMVLEVTGLSEVFGLAARPDLERRSRRGA
jgi:anti-sigma B factor antagonist